MNGIINQNQPAKMSLKDYLNFRTILGSILLVAAVWVLVFMKTFTPGAIYLIGCSLGIFSLSLLISGAKQQNKKFYEKNKN